MIVGGIKLNQRHFGVILSYLSMSLSTIVQIAYVPLLLYYLSKNEYGLYQLIGSLIAYMAVMDFGLSSTIVRYYSRYKIASDDAGKANLLAMLAIIYGVITVFCLIIGASLYISFDEIYEDTLSISELQSAKIMFLILLINIIFKISSNIYTAVITAHERFVFLQAISIINICFKPVVVIAVLSYEASAINLVIVDTVFNFFTIISNIVYCYKKLNIKINLYFWDKVLAKELCGYAFYIFLGVVVDQVYWKTGQLVIGAIVGTGAVAIYSIAMQLDMVFMNIATAVSGVFLPKLSALVIRNDSMVAINDLFIKIGRIQFLILALVFSGFFVYGKQFIFMWVGEGFEDAYYIVILIMLALIIPLTQTIGLLTLQALNKHAFRSKIYFIIAIFSFLLSIPLTKQYGVIGCAAAAGIALLLGNGFIINIYYLKVIHLDILKFFKEIFFLTIPTLMVVTIALFLENFFTAITSLILITKIFFYIVIYGFFMWHLGMNKYEKDIILRILLRRAK